jgi:hypothetical protein
MTRYRANRKPPVKPEGGWLQASYEATWSVEELASRDDLVVKIAPDAGFDDTAYDNQGNLIVYTEEMLEGASEEDKKKFLGKPVGEQHPGVTFPKLGVIEINSAYVDENIKPETMHPLTKKDRERYPVAWGILAHEASHANYSLWTDSLDGEELSEEDQNAAGAAILLEESRIEWRQINSRPQDQRWLQASAMRVAGDEVSSGVKATQKLIAENPDKAPDIDKVKLSRAAALVLARIDAGSIIASQETIELENMVRNTFGDEGYDNLRAIWMETHNVEDDDTEGMMELGRRWFKETGDGGQDQQHGECCESDEGDGDTLTRILSKAAGDAVREASGQAAKDRRKARILSKSEKSAVEAAARRQAKSKADGVFAGEAQPVGHPVTGYRTPTGPEMALARSTRRKLQAAYVPERAVTQVTRVLPPGRLSVRALMQQDAQKKAGLIPDVEPFKYKDRRHVSTPPLKVGIIQDVSGSQSGAARAAVSGAWSLAKATTMIEDTEVAMVSFGNAVHKIIGPRQKLPKVPVISANAGTQYFLDSLRAIEGVLNLTRGGSARLLVILTDGYLSSHDLEGRDAALRRLTEYGVKILWCVTDGDGQEPYIPVHMPGVHVFTKASGNYDVIPSVINHEAVNALKQVSPC